ncbi:hypothetical protein C2E23DRAFT_806364 [Lenzites betulinus]|nr:hypothetical protein C2E23DRAFT_806364 [Lenzites betulinus]
MQDVSRRMAPWPPADTSGNAVCPPSPWHLPGAEWVHSPTNPTDNGAAQAALLRRGCELAGRCTSAAHVYFAPTQPTTVRPHLSAYPPPVWGKRAQDATASWFPQPRCGGSFSPFQHGGSRIGPQVGPHRHHHASRSARMAGTPYGKAAATTRRAAAKAVVVEVDNPDWLVLNDDWLMPQYDPKMRHEA